MTNRTCHISKPATMPPDPLNVSLAIAAEVAQEACQPIAADTQSLSRRQDLRLYIAIVINTLTSCPGFCWNEESAEPFSGPWLLPASLAAAVAAAQVEDWEDSEAAASAEGLEAGGKRRRRRIQGIKKRLVCSRELRGHRENKIRRGYQI